MRVLCIDPALRNTGYAVVEPCGRQGRALAYGVIRNSPKLLQSQCLIGIHKSITEIIAEYQPTTCAMESVIYVQNYRTAIALGAARGAAILAAATAKLPIHEYPPKRVKQAVVGKGAAQKQQVIYMVKTLYGLTEDPPHDAADALAIGLTHLQTLLSRVARSANKAI